MECCGQFERIVNDSGLLRIIRPTDEEIIGSKNSAGIIEKYFFHVAGRCYLLAGSVTRCGEMKVGDNYLCLHTLSDPEDLPSNVSTDCRYERLSTDRSDCRLSFAAPIGILLICNHVVNQYLFIDDSAEILGEMSRLHGTCTRFPVTAVPTRSTANGLKSTERGAHSKGLTSIRAHCNVMARSDDREKLKRIKNDVGSQLAFDGSQTAPQHGGCADSVLAAIPAMPEISRPEETFHTFIEQAPVPVHRGNPSYKPCSPFGVPYGGPLRPESRSI